MRLLNNKGETIVETLYATVIVSFAMIILVGGIIAANKTNEAAKNEDVVFSFTDEKGVFQAPEPKTITVTVGDEQVSETDHKLKISAYKTKNGYIYYDTEPTVTPTPAG